MDNEIWADLEPGKLSFALLNLAIQNQSYLLVILQTLADAESARTGTPSNQSLRAMQSRAEDLRNELSVAWVAFAGEARVSLPKFPGVDPSRQAP